MDCVLRFTGAVKRDTAIDVWLEKQAGELGALARLWFAEFRGCGPDVRELMHDGCPVACVEDVPFGYVNVFKAHVNVGFYHGSALPDATRLLEGTGKRMRHVKLRPDREIDTAALQTLIEAAYQDVQMRVEE